MLCHNFKVLYVDKVLFVVSCLPKLCVNLFVEKMHVQHACVHTYIGTCEK